MTKILLLSDTHSFLDERIFKYAESCDQIWHAGDIGNRQVADALKKIKPLIAVCGNIDGMELRKEFPLHQRFRCEEAEVWLTHIGGSPGKYPAGIKEQLRANPVKLFVCGHTHILKVIFDKKYNMLYMNPGAAGNFGQHKIRTLLRFYIEKKEIRNLEVIEIGKTNLE